MWSIAGADLDALVAPIKALPGVLSVSAFGNTLHVAGLDPTLLEASLAPYRVRADLKLTPAQVDLEDVFISLMDTGKITATIKERLALAGPAEALLSADGPTAATSGTRS